MNICYRIVAEMHKGDISFTSNPGDTRFEIRLPIKTHQQYNRQKQNLLLYYFPPIDPLRFVPYPHQRTVRYR